MPGHGLQALCSRPPTPEASLKRKVFTPQSVPVSTAVQGDKGQSRARFWSSPDRGGLLLGVRISPLSASAAGLVSASVLHTVVERIRLVVLAAIVICKLEPLVTG